jgi:hypothetical protein
MEGVQPQAQKTPPPPSAQQPQGGESMSPEKVSLLQRRNGSDENLHTGKLQRAVVCQRRFEGTKHPLT